MSEKLLSVEDAAAMLGRTPHVVYRLVARRKIPYRKDGRRVLFIERELRAFIEALPGVTLEDLQAREYAALS